MKIQNYLNEDKVSQGKDKLIELRHRIERDIRTGTPAQKAVDKIAEQFGLSKEGNTYKFLLNVAIEYQSHLQDNSIKESSIKKERNNMKLLRRSRKLTESVDLKDDVKEMVVDVLYKRLADYFNSRYKGAGLEFIADYDRMSGAGYILIEYKGEYTDSMIFLDGEDGGGDFSLVLISGNNDRDETTSLSEMCSFIDNYITFLDEFPIF